MGEATFIVGCGDIGGRLAALLQERGAEPTGVVSAAPSALRLRGRGIDAQVCDLDRAAPALSGSVIWLAPPPSSGREDSRIARALAAMPPVRRLLYLSTSGVYGDCGGAWIDEDAPLLPKSERAFRRLDAENRLRQWARATQADLRIVRVPGIYGPGRLPEARLRAGTPVIAPAQAPWTNRIHADDLAAALLAVLDRGWPGGVWNIADGHPTTMSDYFQRCAALLGLPPPPVVDREQARAVMTPAMWSFMAESKRLRVDRLRDELGFVWRYPDLAQGLPSCLPPTEAKPS